jgi:hypothetical protein
MAAPRFRAIGHRLVERFAKVSQFTPDTRPGIHVPVHCSRSNRYCERMLGWHREDVLGKDAPSVMAAPGFKHIGARVVSHLSQVSERDAPKSGRCCHVSLGNSEAEDCAWWSI